MCCERPACLAPGSIASWPAPLDRSAHWRLDLNGGIPDIGLCKAERFGVPLFQRFEISDCGIHRERLAALARFMEVARQRRPNRGVIAIRLRPGSDRCDSLRMALHGYRAFLAGGN